MVLDECNNMKIQMWAFFPPRKVKLYNVVQCTMYNVWDNVSMWVYVLFARKFILKAFFLPSRTL